ncbi:MAG: class II fumarate hydratase [Pseudomonadota bacterium]
MTADPKTRVERDSMGEVHVPAHALYGAQTQRAVDNFAISGQPMPWRLIEALCVIKSEAARVHAELGLLAPELAQAIQEASDQVLAGGHDAQFPVDLFQTGSGTSTNMNVNEVLATLAQRSLGQTVHPNDHVNLGQSSNDIVPSAIHLASALALRDVLHPGLAHLEAAIVRRAGELADLVKTGRTHLMDAMPLTLGQELGGWAAQIHAGRDRLTTVEMRLHQLPLGATAVGTGVNAHPQLAMRLTAALSARTGLALRPADNNFAALSSQDTAVELSGQLRVIAVSLLKISNDLRWMNSGPLAGLGEIALPALQPGSSIMPGKVNPVIPEAVAMVAVQVMGHDASIAIAGQSGSFQLNVMLPLIAHNLLQSILLLGGATRALADRAIAGFVVRHEVLARTRDRNPILATALNPLIGYQAAAEIAKTAYSEDRPILDVAMEKTGRTRAELQHLLDPLRLTRPSD